MTRILMAGGVAALSVAVVVGQTSQPTATSRPAASPVARPQTAPQAPAPVKPVAPATGEEAAKSRALVDQVLRHLPQRAAEDRRAGAGQRPAGSRAPRRPCRVGGKSRPQAARRPDAADRHARRPDAGDAGVADPLDGDRARSPAPSQHLPAPGLHRLNRTEYANAIRDLLALEVDATKFLPPDDSTRGFDNIAGALTMSPALMEAYLSAAGKISRLAIGDVTRADAGGVRRARRHRAEPSHRGAAVRHPRRHADQASVPGRRRLYRST